MQSTKTPTHGYSVGEVLRRGVPTSQDIPINVVRPVPEDPIEKLTYLYKKWLECAGTIAEITQTYDEFFSYSEAVISHPAQYQRLLEHNTAHAMSAVMGGDLEVAFMDLFTSWDLPPHHKDKKKFLDDATRRYDREARRIDNLHRLSAGFTVSDTEQVMHSSSPTLTDYTTSAVAQSIALTMEFINHQVLGELLANKTRAPQRGIKNVGDKIIYLAQSVCQGYEALNDSSDLDEQFALKGVILRAEALMLLCLACKNGNLKDAWPISASQRLHYGHFRHPDDKEINTDLLCTFPSADYTVPIRVHTAKETVKGEAEKVVVFHRSDLYTFDLDHSEKGRRLGAVTFGLLGLPNGAPQSYLDKRATFLATKVNNFGSRIGASIKPWYSNTATLPTPVLEF